MYVCHTHMHACMYVHMYVYVYVRMHTYTHTYVDFPTKDVIRAAMSGAQIWRGVRPLSFCT